MFVKIFKVEVILDSVWWCTTNYKFSLKVYEAVVAWVRSDVSNRSKYMSELMQHVRLPLMPKSYLVQVKELIFCHKNRLIFYRNFILCPFNYLASIFSLKTTQFFHFRLSL